MNWGITIATMLIGMGLLMGLPGIVQIFSPSNDDDIIIVKFAWSILGLVMISCGLGMIL